MRAAQINEPGAIENINLEQEAFSGYRSRLENPSSNWLTIEVSASGICGTDLHIFEGEYLGGYPIIPGHEFSGTITAIGPDVKSLKVGDRVAVEPNLSCGVCSSCLENRQHFCENWQAVGVTLPGGMATHVSVPEQAVFRIGELDFKSGSFMEPLSCVVHGVGKIQPALGDRIALIGAGPIGILLFRVLRSAGAASIDVIEKNDSRAGFAEQAGADTVFKDLSAVKKGAYDIVVDATGVIPVLEQSVDLVRSAGKLLFFGVPPKDKQMKIKPFKLFTNELTIIYSFTSLRNSRQAIDMMRSGQVKVDDLVSHVLPLDELKRGFQLLLNPTEPVMKVMIDPQG